MRQLIPWRLSQAKMGQAKKKSKQSSKCQPSNGRYMQSFSTCTFNIKRPHIRKIRIHHKINSSYGNTRLFLHQNHEFFFPTPSMILTVKKKLKSYVHLGVSSDTWKSFYTNRNKTIWKVPVHKLHYSESLIHTMTNWQ